MNLRFEWQIELKIEHLFQLNEIRSKNSYWKIEY